VITAFNDDTGELETFNPFTETPVEGRHFRLGESFGTARNALDYQTPRTYRVSFGVRF
jgi:hypothetical protein